MSESPPRLIRPEHDEELLALARMLRRSGGHFALAFARASIPLLQQQLAAAAAGALAPLGMSVLAVNLSADTGDPALAILQAVAGRPEKPDAVFVYGLDQLLPGADSQAQVPALAALNRRRGSLQALNCPLVLWVPEYVLALLAQRAPDFWGWRSGSYVFATGPELAESVYQRQVTALSWTGQSNLAREAKWSQTRLLRGLLAEPESISLNKQAYSWYRLADLYQDLGEYPAAERALARAMSLYRQLEAAGRVAAVQRAQADLLSLRGDYGEAERLYRESLAAGAELGDRRGVAVTQGQLADLLSLRGDYGEAERLYRESLAAHAELGDRQGVAATCHNWAQMEQAQGKLEAALELAQRSRELFLELGLDKDLEKVKELIASINLNLAKVSKPSQG